MRASLSRRLEGQGMDAAAELCAEDLVDQLVLLDAGQTREGGGDDLGAEVVPVAGDVRVRIGQSGLDALADLVG